MEFLRGYPSIWRGLRSVHAFVKTLGYPIDLLQYYIAKWAGKPYFGPVLISRQLWINRAPVMSRLIRDELRADGHAPPFRILEIGSWAGGSTLLWGKALQESKRKGAIFCIDHWAAAHNSPLPMQRATRKEKILKLFLHNIRSAKLLDMVHILKGPSDVFTHLLESDSFDFIYIDGDHGYTQFKDDLTRCMALVKIGGIICGDDLEVQLDETDRAHVGLSREKDTIQDPKTKLNLHPGITLAIGEVMGHVSMREGFWAMRRTPSGWAPVILG